MVTLHVSIYMEMKIQKSLLDYQFGAMTSVFYSLKEEIKGENSLRFA